MAAGIGGLPILQMENFEIHLDREEKDDLFQIDVFNSSLHTSPEGKKLDKAHQLAAEKLIKKRLDWKEDEIKDIDNSFQPAATLSSRTDSADQDTKTLSIAAKTLGKKRLLETTAEEKMDRESKRKRLESELSDSASLSSSQDLKTFLTSSSESVSPPPTPVKKGAQKLRPVLQGHQKTEGSPFHSQMSNAKEGFIIFNDQKVYVNRIATGSYFNVFEIWAEKQLFPDVKNEDLVIKIYKDEFFSRDQRFFSGLITNSIQNYRQAANCNLQVAKIRNIDTALANGFFIQDKIPYKLDLNNKEQAEQVRQFFRTSVKQGIPFDLAPSNLRVKEDGSTVVLTDFMESDKKKVFTMNFKKNLIDFVRLYFRTHNAQESKIFLIWLTEGFENFGYDPEWNKEIIETATPFETKI